LILLPAKAGTHFSAARRWEMDPAFAGERETE
jgi:hypothetical protein